MSEYQNALAKFLLSEKNAFAEPQRMLWPARRDPYTGDMGFGHSMFTESLVNGLNFPAKVMRGEVPMFAEYGDGKVHYSPEMIQGANDTAGLAMTGAIGLPKPANAVGAGGGGKMQATNVAERQANAQSWAEISRAADHLSGAVSPNPLLSPQMADDLLRHTPALSQGPQGQASHTSWLNDPSLAEIAARYNLNKTGELSESIARAIASPDGYHYGIRTTPYKVDVGDVMPESKQWYQDAIPREWADLDAFERAKVRDAWGGELSLKEMKARDWDPDFLDHGVPLGGSSTVGFVNPNKDPIKSIPRYESYGSNGDFVHVVRSKYATPGLDDGEMILSDPVVVALAKYKNDLYANPREGAAAAQMTNAGQQDDNQLMNLLRQYGLY